MEASAVVLNKILSGKDIELWAKLKLSFLDAAYTNLYAVITRHYDKYNTVPTFEDLELVCREGQVQKTLAIIKLADEPDISGEVALDALIDQFTQNEVIKQLDKFIDKLPTYDTEEIKENLSSIVLHLDSKTLTTEGVYDMSNIMLFKYAEELANDRTHLGLNNTFDATLAGVARQELILIGGKRGSGKSIICSNLCINQYEMGNTTAYFTIEMVAHETLERNMSIGANVDHMRLKQNSLTDDELLRVIKYRAGMFQDSDQLVEEFKIHRDKYKFEREVVRKELKPDNQMIIIDDRALTLTSLDLHLGKIKAKFGDKFTLAEVDYLNQIVLGPDTQVTEQFDWKPQVIVSKKLKELARKHDIAIVAPYQTNDKNETRFAHGILDAADIALIMEAYDKDKNAIGFRTTKIRGGPEMVFTSPIDWSTLRISPIPISAPEKPIEIKKAGKGSKKTEESATDAPW